jgi:5-methylcytosine-specific restriction endonuclease McrA
MKWNKKDVLACFKMPVSSAITGRKTTIRNVFVSAIIPMMQPGAEEIAEVLELLDLDPLDLRCSYCGDPASEWDHLRPLVKAGRPTGYFSSIRNLVPSCGKCNQSKGSSDWKKWMLGSARRSPSVRKITDINGRIERLERLEEWAGCIPIKVEELVAPELLNQYYSIQDEILAKMRDAQEIAKKIAHEIKLRSNHRV